MHAPNTPEQPPQPDHYDRMLARTEQQQGGGHTLREALDWAVDHASALGELSREQAQQVADWLQRDLQDAAHFLNESGSELQQWLRFDRDLVVDELFELLDRLVDRSRVELVAWQRESEQLAEWRSGELTGIGTLTCVACGATLSFEQSAPIPHCPSCGGDRFRRLIDTDA